MKKALLIWFAVMSLAVSLCKINFAWAENEFDATKIVALQNAKAYYIGADRKYEAIADALVAWKKDKYPNAIFYIASGVYDEHNNVPSTPAKIAFIGENREDTIIQDNTGTYENAPFVCHNGNIIFENITFIADHSGNKKFDYNGYVSSGKSKAPLNAYALHTDQGTNPGDFIVYNCTLISYQDAALGCGTIEGQNVVLENCALYSYTDTVESFPYANVSLSHGGLLYHTYAKEETRYENITLKNVTVYSKNSPHVFCYQSFSKDGIFHNLECVNVSLSGGISSGSDMFYPTSRSKTFPKPWYILSKNSTGNNVDCLNYVESDEN